MMTGHTVLASGAHSSAYGQTSWLVQTSLHSVQSKLWPGQLEARQLSSCNSRKSGVALTSALSGWDGPMASLGADKLSMGSHGH